jgi:hypothetical protein
VGSATVRGHRRLDPLLEGGRGGEQLRGALRFILPDGNAGQAFQGVRDDHLVVDVVRERKARPE